MNLYIDDFIRRKTSLIILCTVVSAQSAQNASAVQLRADPQEEVAQWPLGEKIVYR